ncbi:hypothetical protein Val02_85470 [Virgisporangium aliadipatigenens]|uniref:Uncharacterized protein n=1 Tax=Virgisporangium aliadipatigenens TaxID=741659 RepID=A0A8J3YUB2_9ACTN|nr:hypothetical protein Val02_85470 [Virgisporangium aliadipatigenens]
MGGPIEFVPRQVAQPADGGDAGSNWQGIRFYFCSQKESVCSSSNSASDDRKYPEGHRLRSAYSANGGTRRSEQLAWAEARRRDTFALNLAWSGFNETGLQIACHTKDF